MDRLSAIATTGRMTPRDNKISKVPEKKYILQLQKSLAEMRIPYEERWKDIRDYQLPFLGEFSDTEDETNRARRKDLMIANGCAWAANCAFAAGIMSGLTPPSRQWFKFGFSDSSANEDIEAAAILDKRQEVVEYMLHKSNFYNAIYSAYMELGYGQAPLGVFASDETGVRYQHYTVGTYYLSGSTGGRVDTFIRRFQMTAEQLKNQFGIDRLPNHVKEVLKGAASVTKKFTTYWIVLPNKVKTPTGIGAGNMPYISLYYIENQSETENGGYIYTGGFEEFPVPVARYQVIEGSAYGKGPGWYAEGDARMLQIMKKDLLTAVELMVKPPMKGPADVTNTGGVNLIPGGYTAINNLAGNNTVEPLFQIPVNPQWLAAEIQKTEESIKRIYSADLFLMLDSIDTPQMTAREVMERQQEKLQQLGPVVERLQDEFLSPIIERTYNIAERMGIFEPIPEEVAERLMNQDIKIEYISPLAQAQKMSGLVNIEQAVSFVGQIAQLYPDALKAIDPVGTVKRYFELLGAPAIMQRSTEEIEKMIKAEQEMQQQMQEQQQMQMAAQTMAPAAEAAKNLTEATKDGNPALNNALGLGVM